MYRPDFMVYKIEKTVPKGTVFWNSYFQLRNRSVTFFKKCVTAHHYFQRLLLLSIYSIEAEQTWREDFCSRRFENDLHPILDVSLRKQANGPYQLSNKSSGIVMRMAGPVFGTGRYIVADNWFSDLSLINELRKQKVSYVGTVRKNRRALPALIKHNSLSLTSVMNTGK
ncbi:hypothetical protein WA026_006304 [Henosepilachna vigintioctopunctata]|uniref:PiggyBac transposable element-derived protein domain-containing protein n=1 Tax=Henosepilachna vigintioctopunctata TaxID=420089 RepID=A0AAW1TPE3_9CUCU